MKNTLAILFLLFLSSTNNYVLGQKERYKTYIDSKNHFSFDISSSWKITSDKDTTESNSLITCIPTTKDEIDIYKECFDGIVFYIFLFKTNLDSTLQDEGYWKYGNNYFTSDRVSDSVKTENIKGVNWNGIYHLNTCGISCTETGFHAVLGQCDFFYFSNGKITVCLTTTGHSFDEYYKKQLLKTFKFK